MRCSRGKTSVAPQRVRITQSLTVEPTPCRPAKPSRVDTVSARAAGPAGRHPLRRQRAGAAHDRARIDAAAHGLLRAQGRRRQADDVRRHLRADDSRRSTTRSIPTKVDAVEPTRELAPYLGERPPHIVFTDDLRKFSREAASATRRNPYASRRSCSRRRRHSVGRRARILDATKHQRLRAARPPRRLRPADAAADHAAAPQRHSRALAIGNDVLRRRLREPARLGPGVPRALWLGADGRDVRPPRSRRPATRRVLSRRARRATASPSTTTTASRSPAKTHFRSETVDLQRGEVEWRGGNLYFDKFDYTFEATASKRIRLGGMGTGRWRSEQEQCEASAM